jgi:hypothetical protein
MSKDSFRKMHAIRGGVRRQGTLYMTPGRRRGQVCPPPGSTRSYSSDISKYSNCFGRKGFGSLATTLRLFVLAISSAILR